MANRKRLIDEKMAQLPTRRYGAYLRKMAIDGYIIQLDTTDIERMNAALSAIGRNINQIAKRINAGGGAYKADMQEIQERLDEIYVETKNPEKSRQKAAGCRNTQEVIYTQPLFITPFYLLKGYRSDRLDINIPVIPKAARRDGFTR